MKSLSQSEYGELRSLYESVYAPKFESILDEFTDEDLDDLTDEYIEEQVTEFFNECLEEGLDIEILEETICESIDSELELLSEVTNPAKVAALRAKNKVAAAAGEGSGDAGAKARARLNVSKQKVSGSSEKKASALSRIKGAVKKVGKAVQGGVGLAARAVSTAQRAGSAVKSAAKKGYERGKKGSGSESSTDSSTPSSSSSSGESSTYSSTPSSSSSSGTSAAPKKRKDGLLKRGLKKLVRGVGKAASVGAGAVKAGADYVTDRARKEQMNYNDVATIQELYNQMYAPQDVEEVYKGKHGQSDKEYIEEDSRRMSNKQHTKRVRSNIKAFGSNYTPPSNYDPDANRGQGEVLTRKQIEKNRRKSLRQEEFDTFDVVLEFLQVEGYAETLEEAEWMMANIIDEEAIDIILGEELTGERLKRAEDKIKSLGRRKSTADKRTSLFKVAYGKEGTGLPGSDGQSGGRKGPVKRGGGGTKGYGKVSGSGRDDMDRGYGNKAARRAEALKKEAFEAWIDEAMSSYDRNRKRAAQRAAARNAARDAGKTGVVPGVGYVTPRRERETYVDSAGTTRHKSGAKMPKEEFELDENRRAARAAGGYKDDSKKQTDPSKAGFTGISNSIADIMRQNKEIEARKKK